MTEIARIAIDTSKSVFTLHGVDASGRAVLRRNLRRRELLRFFERLPPVEVVLEACGGSHHWGRTLLALGHRVRLIPPQYVKPFVKRGKNDRNDAEAISVAATQPSIGSVPVKSAAQQAAAMLLSVRELLVRQRTQLVNAMRGHAAEMGVVAPLGGKGLAELQTEIAAADEAAVPAAAKQAIALLGREAERIETRLRAIDTTLMQQHRANPVSRRLAAIPGIGPIAALSFTLRVDPTQFASARHFSAWLGLVPRECSTGRQAAPGRHQPGRQRAAAAAADAGRDGGHPACQAGSASRLAMAAEPAGPQAAQARRRGLGQQNGPHRVGHDDKRGGLPASAGAGLIACLPRGQGSREKMLIGRSDDPQNPCRVAASKVALPFGSGSRNPSGPAAAAATNRPDTRPQPHRSKIPLSDPLHPRGRPHTMGWSFADKRASCLPSTFSKQWANIILKTRRFSGSKRCLATACSTRRASRMMGSNSAIQTRRHAARRGLPGAGRRASGVRGAQGQRIVRSRAVNCCSAGGAGTRHR